MAIQWYPGHMHKAQKEMKEVLPSIDVFIEVLDARIPYSSKNPLIASIRKDKPCIKVLTKTDLADPESTARWQAHFEQESDVRTIATSTDEPARFKQIKTLCRQMLPEREASVQNIKAMICGIPNVGKSTLINILSDRIIAKTGNEPAVTKTQQRINLGDGISLLDTPGILWPKIENPNSGYRLAACAAIKDTAIDYQDIGFYLADFLIKAYPDVISERFKLEYVPDTEIEFLDMAAANRGALRSGGRANLHKICEVLINEFRSSKLGRITLELPEMIEQEEALMAKEIEKKEAAAAERKARFKQGKKGMSKHDVKAELRAQRKEKLSGRKPR
jgi:ribosome biogenesis GTPase A